MSGADSFDGLELSPALLEALVAEGIESPTPLQAHAIPVVRRGHSAVLRGAPGSGVLAAYGIGLLERIEPGGRRPSALVLTTGRDRANALAHSLARLASASDHRIAALGSAWALPGLADILVATPADLSRAVASARVKVDEVGTLVVDGASFLLEEEGEEPFGAILPGPDEERQFILVSESVTPVVRSFVERHAKRAVFLPPEASAETEPEAGVRRGRLRVREATGDEEDEVASLVAELLADDHAHVLLFLRSEDRAADVGDALSLRGFRAGAPGESDVPVWLAVDAPEAREAAGAAPDCAFVSMDVPTDADQLDRRHGRRDSEGFVLIRPREAPHLRRIAREAGYELAPFPAPKPEGADPTAAFLDRVQDVLDREDLAPYVLLLEPLLEERGAAQVAAALAILARRGQGTADAGRAGPEATSEDAERFTWVRLFVSTGEKDGIGPGDLLGAIVGETGIRADQVGRIDVRDKFSRVEVDPDVADRIIRALNGTSIRGRSLRVDYDRGEPKGRGEGKGKGKGRPGGKRKLRRGPGGPET